PEVLEALRRDFGHPALRPGQASVISRVMARRDTLAIMPTGAGKSLTFQLPSMLLPGVTLVLSPLIALMKDQVEGLPAAVQERTALINSTLSRDEMREALDRLASGSLKLIYAAPERLRHNAFLKALRQAGVALVVVDEAHCVSMWGHDFRPDYLTIPRALPEMGDPPVLAITATATPAMVRQIAAGFGRELDVIRVSVFRSNLFYEVHRLPNREEKVAKAIEIARQEQGAGIIYVSSRKDAEALANLLRDRGVWALPYHAGLDSEVRARNQELFMRGRARVMAATVAFGMGVDKADVRFIVHLSPPSSLEAYAQESGRAGRDSMPAKCALLVAPSDQASLTRNARRDELDLDTLRRVYAGIKRAATGRWAIFDPGTLLPYSFDDDEEEAIDPRVALGLLEQAALIRRHPDAPIGLTLRWTASADTVTSNPEAWARFEAWLGPERRQGGASIRTAEACEATGLTPRELDLLLSDRDDLLVRDGPRATCLELLPVQGDAGTTLTQLIERARADARRRIKQVMDYAAGNRCRHAVLAAHLGERLDPCGEVCDVCTGSVAKRADAATSAATTRTRITAQDAMAVLNGVRTLPYQMGKPGLTKLLLGSVESRGSATRAPSFGALAGFKKSQIERLIDRLIADGLLYRDLDHEYKIITLTERGDSAAIDDLAAYEDAAAARPARAVRESTPSFDDDADLDPEDHELLDALHTWRRERASADAVPPYVIAHNSQLRNLAIARPRTLAALGNVPGFGPARVEKYGAELLELIAQDS
ncbi:MAG: RecQ family ATP-dependent DNA helicase, partial [Thermomicrobiales bacterium]